MLQLPARDSALDSALDSARSAADTIAAIVPPTTFGGAVGLITSKLESWMTAAVARLPNLAVAVLVVVLGWAIARIARDVLTRAFRRTPLTTPIRSLLTTVISTMVLATGLFIALGVLGLDRTVTSLLAGVGIVGLALGIAFQDIAANFMAGIILSFRQPFTVGQMVEIVEHTGMVEEITLRSTVLRTFPGQTVRIPNKEVIGNPIVNFSVGGQRRVDLTVGVSYGEDLEHVQRVAIAAVEALDHRTRARPVELFFSAFGESSIDFDLRFWIPFARQTDYLAARSAAVMAIKRAFDREGITIPFPIRTLDFARVGGRTLGEELEPLASSDGRTR